MIPRRPSLIVALVSVTLTALASGARAEARQLDLQPKIASERATLFWIPASITLHSVRRAEIQAPRYRRTLGRAWVRNAVSKRLGLVHVPEPARRAKSLRLRLTLRPEASKSRATQGSGQDNCSGAPVNMLAAWRSGCWRPFSAKSPFNRALPSSPAVAPGSEAMIATLLRPGPVSYLRTGKLPPGEDWGHAVYFSHASDPAYRVTCTEPWGRCEVEGNRIHIPRSAVPADGSDAHLSVIDAASGWEYDFWGVRSKPSAGGRLVVRWGGRTRLSGDGLGSNATAAHFAGSLGIVRAGELARGHIDHALFVLAPCVSGAVGQALRSSTSCPPGTVGPPLGARIRLNIDEAELDSMPLPLWKKTILRALRDYGAFIGDTNGSTWAIQVESPESYRAFGLSDPFSDVARASDAPTWSGVSYLDLAAGVDWAGRLQVLQSCGSARACS